MIVFNSLQDAANKLDEDASRCESNPLAEAAKRIAKKWMEMAKLMRSEFILL